jgi:hypothetical protein
VAVDHRSALPLVPGIPWWGAAIVAVALTAIGVAFDAGSGTNALGGVFAACYVLGCLAAVLAVRQSGIFTAVIQPPLILFVAVPFAYFVFHGSTFTGIKDTLINCGYPLIERFPLMFFTSAAVLLVGLIRWYLGMAAKRVLPKDAEQTAEAPDEAAVAASTLAAKGRRSTRGTRSAEARAARAAAADSVDPMDDEAPRPSRRTSRTAAAGSERSTGAAAGKGSRRSRHSRPPETEIIEPVLDRPRRRNTPPVDPPAEPRRRPRASEPRSREPRESRESRDRRPLPPLDRRGGSPDRDRPERERYDRPQRRERADSYERPERPERRRPRASDYEPYEPYEPPVTRTNGSSGTHHPISRVRYRGSEDDESRTEHRTKPRRPRHSAPDSWE